MLANKVLNRAKQYSKSSWIVKSMFVVQLVLMVSALVLGIVSGNYLLLVLFVLICAGFVVLLYLAVDRFMVMKSRLTEERNKRRSAEALYDSQAASAVNDLKFPILTSAVNDLEFPTLSSQTSRRLVQRLTMVRSYTGRNVLTVRISGGTYSWDELSAILEACDLAGFVLPRVDSVFASISDEDLCLLADLLFRQNLRSSDIRNAAILYGIVYDRGGLQTIMQKKRFEFALDSVSRYGGTELFRILHDKYAVNMGDSNDLKMFRANALKFTGVSMKSGNDWLGEINEMYAHEGLSPISFEHEGDPDFLSLTSNEYAFIDDGPLVTIVMPVFRPDVYSTLAFNSALAQSYRTFELIVVDDGSGPEYEELLMDWEETDPRVRVVRLPDNRGAYTARNTGYELAEGKYLTIFDGDDWQHPQKIELLVKAAEASTDSQLISSPWVRVNENLAFVYRGWRGAFVTPAHVSTLFPVDVIRRELGYWDSVRKAADTEFILRYKLLVNPLEPLEVCVAPLTLSLVTMNNLSVEDFRLGYRAADRVSYRDSYEQWHKEVKETDVSGYLEFSPAIRPFPAPNRFLPISSSAADLDVILVGDFGDSDNMSTTLLQELATAKSRKITIGLLHKPNIFKTKSFNYSYSENFLNEFARGVYRRVEASDTLRTERLFIFDPSSFEYASEAPCRISARFTTIWAEQDPYSAVDETIAYRPSVVTQNIQDSFGGTIDWVRLYETGNEKA